MNQRMKFIAPLFICFVIFSCSDKSERALDQKKMFKKQINEYYNSPVKFLILDSKYKLKHFSFYEASAPFYLDGISLTFSNDVKILVRINELRYETKRKEGKLWDVNKVLLEHASKIELISDQSIDYKDFKQSVNIEFISADSIVVRDDFYDFYLKKKQMLDSIKPNPK